VTDHFKGLLITTLGVLLVVPDSLFVRLIDADPLITAFWRGIIAGGFILVGLLLFQGLSGFKGILRSGKPGLVYTFLIGSTAPAFVLAVTNTSVANVVFIFATIPIFASIFSLVFLKEPIRRNMVVTIFFVLIGLGVIAYGSGYSEVASWEGDLWALYVSVAFAGALTAVRQVKEISMIPAIPIAYIGSAVLIGLFYLPLYLPLQEFKQDWHLFLGHGAFIAGATCLLTLGPRFLSSPEVSLLILLESVLAPILVWWFLGEYPGEWAIAGGALVILTLIVSNLMLSFSGERQ
jgi:drug/metabolite transporter (DMT)-like permease|tara:strand:- start:902 stop:1777 length:876 start_codon:yes stop_codon:yes gene_type:complete